MVSLKIRHRYLQSTLSTITSSLINICIFRSTHDTFLSTYHRLVLHLLSIYYNNNNKYKQIKYLSTPLHHIKQHIPSHQFNIIERTSPWYLPTLYTGIQAIRIQLLFCVHCLVWHFTIEPSARAASCVYYSAIRQHYAYSVIMVCNLNRHHILFIFQHY